MDYGQYTSMATFGNQSLHHQPQSQPPQPQQQAQEQEQGQQQDQLQPQVQDQEQVQVRQLPQLRQEQLLQLQQQLQQQFFSSSQCHQAHLSTSGFAPPAPSPWDSPLDSLGTPTPTPAFGFSDAQLAAAMNMVATASVTGAYGRAQQDSLLPPITTLEMADASALTPSSGTSVATPGSTATATGSPLAIRTEMALQDKQAQPQVQVPYESQHEQVQVQGQYQAPQVIQLVERPQRKSRARARASQQTPKAQAQARKQNRRESQDELQTEAKAQAQARPASSQSTSKSSVGHQQGQVRAPGPDPPALVTSVPSPGQWYGIHALPASQLRVGVGLKSSVNGKLPSQLQRQTAREAVHPYPLRLRQRRTVSGPAALSGMSVSSQDDTGPVPVNTPSPSTSLPAPSPVSTSPSTSAPTPGSASIPARPSIPRYLVRADVHYDISSNTLTAMLEIPGVPRAAIRVELGYDGKTGARLLIVRGRMRRVAFPPPPVRNAKGKGKEAESLNSDGKEGGGGQVKNDDAGYMVKERKMGEFKRVLVVPAETKNEDIQVSMADGIMFLRYPAGDQSLALAALHSARSAHTTNSTPRAQVQLPHSAIQALTAAANGLSTPAVRPAQNQGPGGMQINFRVQTPAATSASGGQSSAVPSSSNSNRGNNVD